MEFTKLKHSCCSFSTTLMFCTQWHATLWHLGCSVCLRMHHLGCLSSWCRHQRSPCLYLYDSSWSAPCRALTSRRQAPDTTLAMGHQQALHLLQGLPTSSLHHVRMYLYMQLLRLIWMADLHCWYAGLSFPIAITTCAANRHKSCFPAVTVLMESLLSKEQHLHASL